MNISKSFINDVVKSMEKYGFSAGGGGGGIVTIHVSSAGVTVSESYETIKNAYENLTPLPVYIIDNGKCYLPDDYISSTDGIEICYKNMEYSIVMHKNGNIDLNNIG